jgi:uncharacterized protein YecE (DUF72 family)
VGRITIGTSSWSDPGFVRDWYPPRLPAGERLEWYAQHFDAVEINSTFYGLPETSVVAGWAATTPARFSFDWKLHRALSRHAAGRDSLPSDLRPLATTERRGRVVLDERLERRLVDRTLASAEPLVAAGKLSCFLLQLSPSFSPRSHALAELESLVQALTPHIVAIELRHRDWLAPERLEQTLQWYEHVGATFVCIDGPAQETRAPTVLPSVDAVTRPELAYLRAHGRNLEGYLKGRSVAERFDWRYSDDELRELAGRATDLGARAHDVRVMLNNNRSSFAPEAAARLRELLGQTAPATT